MKCFPKEKQELFIDVAILIATNSELSFNRILTDPKLGIKYSIKCLEYDFVFVISIFSFILKTVLDF